MEEGETEMRSIDEERNGVNHISTQLNNAAIATIASLFEDRPRVCFLPSLNHILPNVSHHNHKANAWDALHQASSILSPMDPTLLQPLANWARDNTSIRGRREEINISQYALLLQETHS
ncbi:hypothetical protein EYF80_010435 [Liparis tanakae]|uniref:Uncharacterized protein n=1 Tax=Liparis tanakae TaxID=230148 RepID=A0A4Z2INM4_9TELE|nr:hypothetical protein EYF80_010435 [Liparis tanakae]